MYIYPYIYIYIYIYIYNADLYKDNFNLSFTPSNVNSKYQYRNDFQRNIQSK